MMQKFMNFVTYIIILFISAVFGSFLQIKYDVWGQLIEYVKGVL